MRLIRFETVHQQSFSNSGDVLSLWSLCPSLVVANEFSTGGTLPRVVRSEKVVCSDVYINSAILDPVIFPLTKERKLIYL